MVLNKIKSDLRKLAKRKKASDLGRFFKCGPGEYGEGDLFIGVSVPNARKVAKKYANEISLGKTEKLLGEKIHEYRQTALFILVEKFQRKEDAGEGTREGTQKEIVKLYLQNTKNVNNWDLVDLSAHKIIGAYLIDKKSQRKILYRLAKSKDLWEKRIAIVSTFAFIAERDFKNTLEISRLLLQDDHDLIHKAVGWALREVGNKDLATEEKFLKKHYQKMPRTMLRYAIEKFPEPKRQKYLKGMI